MGIIKKRRVSGLFKWGRYSNWQRNIRQDSAAQNFSAIYKAKFGDETYSKLKEMRTWLNSHEQKSDLRAYLLAEDPYSAEK